MRFTAENATKPEIKVVGASVDVRQDWNNVKAEPIATGKTDAKGYYAVSLDAGYYTVRVTSTDYYTPYTFTVAIKPEATMPSEEKIQMSPMFEIPEEERDNLSSFRVVLTWGLYPSDLDSHLTAKLSDDTYFHIAYYSRSGYDNGIRVASLDVDDVTSYGPETVSLTSFDKEGNYDYYVHWYSGSGSWATSNAKVTLWLSNSDTPAVFEVPTEGTDATTTSYGKKRYWHVFSIRNGVFTTINEIVSSPYTTPNAGDTNTRTRSVSGVKSEPQKTYYTDK